ncbi:MULTISPECIES: SOS response-associated peptidase [Achromobacter]|uniref:Abasic site processing protein n=1 Tax=Achromobacter spanius TaxID=217203 RepID=A0AA42LVI0_9BURK|nr:SOS response-associated peptidase [Achromobacter spanius]MDH0740354.1 SOS response-associated peptidase [Achromobacter spanius]
MCGRIVQKSGPLDYVERIFTNPGQIFADPTGPRFNIPPGTRPLTLHRLAEGSEAMARLPWGYKRPDSKHFMSNAKLETILKNGWPWRFLIGPGRILVPADGWYEWPVQSDGSKQPYYIHGQGPLYFAALTAWEPGDELDAAHGFAIVTNDTQGGMVDIHARRPVALPPDVARRWVDPSCPTAEARVLLNEALPEDVFTWHPVRVDVGNSKYQLPDAIEPI